MTAKTRESRRINGVRKSWKAANELNDRSKHDRSTPKLARQFLSLNAAYKKLVQSHDQLPITLELLRSYSTWLSTLRRKRRATVPAVSNNGHHDGHHANQDVLMLYKVKQFLKEHSISVDQMSNILDTIRQLTT